jgi:hypothetical protein
MLFNVLSPLAVGIDANTFSDAAKRFVEMQRNLDITRIILADRFNNAMRADVAYRVRDGNVVAGINLTPTIYPTMPYQTMPYPAVATTSPYMPYPVGAGVVDSVTPMNSLGMPMQPAGLIKTTSEGQQVFPVKDGNLAVGGVNANLMGVGVNPLGVGFGYAPTMAHGIMTPMGLNKKSKQ